MKRKPTNESDKCIDADIDPARKIVIVPHENKQMLSNTEYVDYRNYRERYLKWLLNVGKNPGKAQGYSPYTVYESGYRAARFDRWNWDHHGQYRTPPTHDDADEFITEQAFTDKAQSSKGKLVETLKRYFKWLATFTDTEEWECKYSFKSGGSTSSGPRDFLSKAERKQIRKTSLNFGQIPNYNTVTPEQRKRWKQYIADVLDKSADDVVVTDWDKVESWEKTTIVWVSLDAGLRPVEVGNARVQWVDTENEVLRIPREESSKNEGNWVVSLTSKTTEALKEWLKERELYERYDGSDKLWLTSHGNAYASKSLNRMLKRICDSAGIPTAHRKMTWYSIRHSVGTFMTAERDLAATKAQLRHKSVKTTMQYDQVPVEDRQEALDNIG